MKLDAAARAELFKRRAAELREIAATMADEVSRVEMLRMAVSYDTLALRLESPLTAIAPPEGQTLPGT